MRLSLQTLSLWLAISSFKAVNAWVLDKSCTKIWDLGSETVMKEGIAGAFKLAHAALDALKEDPPQNEHVANLYSWLFKDPTPDPVEDKVARERIMRNLNEVIKLEKESTDKTNVNDVVIYCDFSRFKENEEAAKAYDPDIQDDWPINEQYKNCKNSLSTSDVVAFTENNPIGPKIAQVQLCPWYVGAMKQYKYKVWGTIRPKSLISRLRLRVQQITGKSKRIELAALLDHTLLHELTHAVKKDSTDDVGGSKKAYGWDNCLKLAGRWGGYYNADSVAYFALGTSMITRVEEKDYFLRPNKDGSVDKIKVSAKRFVEAIRRAIPWTG